MALAMRISLGAANFAKEAIGWLAISSVIVIGVFYFSDLRAMSRSYIAGTSEQDANAPAAAPSGQAIESAGEVHIRAADNGHFFSDVDVNGHSVSVVVDTGATGVSLTYEDARDIGLRLEDTDFTMESRTANGSARIAPVMLNRVRIGDIEVRDVEAYVAEKGKLFQTLLGMSFLRRLSHIDIKGGELVLSQ